MEQKTQPDETEKTISRPGCDVHYWVSGNSSKPLIILIHGACADHRQFDMQIPCLIQDYQIVRVDVRGHGLSRPLAGPFSVPDAVEDIVSILKETGRNNAIFLGQSNGTYIIQELEFRHPGMVRAMIIVDGTYIFQKLSRAEKLLLKLTPAIMSLYPYGSLIKSMADGSAVKESTRAYLRETFGRLSKAEIINIMSGVSGCVHPEPGYRTGCPLLLIRGEHDKLGNIKAAMKEWSLREPRSKYVVIPDAGHCSNQDNPEQFNAMMMEFLKGLPELVSYSR
ncbi:alpha/beta fold hydrolase [Methanocella arvoryzae]|uniref:Hydrolase (Alpha/beta fold family) n=1 Tax=Methanocella arvoryzae (strain DSM 22066 / NBRC 105507 / MRE50) TaxID=351160 RepID=Q0W5M5_METAR|nr:alpha/beta hydrolase [Methanocella arvoryzae]CAJ36318.1 putative hydrolase (alpha/beta fold family) [Methanocella arvoryzae MRE50]